MTDHWKTVLSAAILFGLPIIAGLTAGWTRSSGHDSRLGFWLLVFLLTVPSLVPIAIDSLSGFTLNPRHAMVCLIPIQAFLALGIFAMRKNVRTGILIGVSVVTVLSLENFYTNPAYSKEDARAASEFLNALEDDGLVILVLTYPTPIKRYYSGSAQIRGPNDVSFANERQLEAAINELASDHRTLAFVDLRAWHSRDSRQIQEFLTKAYPLIEAQEFHGISINTYDIQSELRGS